MTQIKITKCLSIPIKYVLISVFLSLFGFVLSVSAESDMNTKPTPQGLSAALQTMIQHNPALKGKVAELNAQGYGIDSANAGRYPTLSAQANNLTDDMGQGMLRLQQPLYAFGKIDNAIAYAEAGYSVEQWDLLRVQRQLIEDTAVAYARVEGLKQQLDIAAENIAEHEQLYQRIKRRSEGRLASEADARMAYSRLVQSRASQQRFRGELEVAYSDLLTLTQVEVDTSMVIDPELAVFSSLVEVKQQALMNSVEIELKKAQLKAIRMQLKQEESASLPTVYFRVEHDFLDTPRGTDETRAGLAIEANVEGMGFASRGRVKGAESRLNAAQYEVDVTQNDIKRRVTTLMLNRNVQQRLLNFQYEAVEAIQATMASFLRQYESGRKTWIEVLNTQRELTDLRIQLAKLKNEWLILSLRVSALIGNLDSQAGIARP